MKEAPHWDVAFIMTRDGITIGSDSRSHVKAESMSFKRLFYVVSPALLTVLVSWTCFRHDGYHAPIREATLETPKNRHRTLVVKETPNTTERPVIKTFFERIHPDKRLTGMTDEADDALLEFWKTCWYNAGWDPQVISTENAKKHPEYENYIRVLDSVNMDEFNRLMFLRWLAMAGSGGGWMADYDVFPLRDFTVATLPQDGKLVIYDKRLLPQLVSGSAESWLSVGKALLETAKQNENVNPKKQTYWTDTLGLLQISRESVVEVHCKDYMVMERKALKGTSLLPEECDKSRFTRNRIAVHFGFEALLEGNIDPQLRLPHHRLTIAKKWLSDFHDTCPWTRIDL